MAMKLPLKKIFPNWGEVIDSATLDMEKLGLFFKDQIRKAKEENLLFSLHMKATMMKVSDPIIFGKCVEVFYASIFEKYGQELKEAGVDVNNGSGNLFSKIDEMPMKQENKSIPI